MSQMQRCVLAFYSVETVGTSLGYPHGKGWGYPYGKRIEKPLGIGAFAMCFHHRGHGKPAGCPGQLAGYSWESRTGCAWATRTGLDISQRVFAIASRILFGMAQQRIGFYSYNPLGIGAVAMCFRHR